MGKQSARKQTLAGVAQGTITAPNTFKISTNGLARVLTSLPAVEFNKFADDELFWVTHKCEKTAAIILQKALKIAVAWLEVHGFKINPSKSFYQIFTFKHHVEKPLLLINGKEVQEERNGVYLGVVLDSKLSGKAHFEAAAEKANKRLRLLQRACGTSWGARMQTLALTYKSYVRPILEYGTEVFASASENQMDILNKVQNKALRLITGAVKTTPIVAMEIYSHIEPLNRRLERRAIVLHEKLARLNPRRWLQFPTTTTKGHTTFAQMATTLKEEYCPELLHLPRHPLQLPTLQSIPSPSSSIIPSLEIEGVKNRKDCSTADLQRLADAHLEKKFPLATWVHIFTDGALNPATNRSAYSVYCIFFEEHAPMAPGTTAFDAEVAAIVKAAEHVAVKPEHPLNKTNFVILSDNKAALQLLSSSYSCDPQSLAFKTHLVSIRSRQLELQLQWIPGHAKIRGNDKADALAKMGTRMPQPPPQAVHLSSVRTRLQTITKDLVAADHQVQSQQKQWAAEVGSGPKPGWSRKTTTAQFRLATGHDVLQHHLCRFKIVDEPATCKICKFEPQDRAHLFRCAALQEFLIDLPEDMSKEEKEAVLYWIARKKNG